MKQMQRRLGWMRWRSNGQNAFDAFYSSQINYFNSDSREMTQLSEYNIQYLDDLKERVIHPYVYGHSFKFGGIDLVMASVHCFKVYESECPVDGFLNLGYEGIREVTRKVMESVK